MNFSSSGAKLLVCLFLLSSSVLKAEVESLPVKTDDVKVEVVNNTMPDEWTSNFWILKGNDIYVFYAGELYDDLNDPIEFKLDLRFIGDEGPPRVSIDKIKVNNKQPEDFPYPVDDCILKKFVVKADEKPIINVSLSDTQERQTPMTLHFLPVELIDVKGTGELDDTAITPWDTSQDISNNNIAWIDAHHSAQNATPRMPQLELRVLGLPEELIIKAKINIQYTRGNDARANRNQAEDRVRIPNDGSFVEVDRDNWQLYDEKNWQTELNDRGFFGGEATITYKILKGGAITFGPEEITFRIGGQNSDFNRCKNYIESFPNTGSEKNLWFSYAIAKSESADYNGEGTRYNQFLTLPTDLEDTNYLTRRRTHAGRPLWGNDGGTSPGGYGMFQVTGNVASELANIPREKIWNWQENVKAGITILESKRVTAYSDMANQRQQANVDLPMHTVRGVTFKDGTTKIMEAAQTMKLFNGASRSLFTNPDAGNINGFILDSHSSGNYCYWRTDERIKDPAKPDENNPNAHGDPPRKDGIVQDVNDGWSLSRLNILNNNYVDRVCRYVKNDDQ